MIPPPVMMARDAALPPQLQAGLERQLRGELPAAERIYREFLQAHPGHAQALQFLGVLAAQIGKYEPAVRFLLQAIQQQPELADARYSLGNVFLAQGRRGDAVTAYTQALALEHPHAGSRLAALLASLGASEQARSARLLAELLLTRGQVSEALEHTRRAIELEPEERQNWVPLGRCLTSLKFNNQLSSTMLALLLAAWSRDGMDHQNMVRATLSALRQEPGLAEPLTLDATDSAAFVALLAGRLETGRLDAMAGNLLFMKMLDTAIVTDPGFERLLTGLRRAILQSAVDGHGCRWIRRRTYRFSAASRTSVSSTSTFLPRRCRSGTWWPACNVR